MRDVLVLCPTARERRLLPAIAAAAGCRLRFDRLGGDCLDGLLEADAMDDTGAAPGPHGAEPAFDALAAVARLTAEVQRGGVAGVTTAVAYPGACLASAVAAAAGLPGPSPAAVLACEHKHRAREIAAAAVPEATPPFALLEPADLAAPGRRAERAAAELGERVGYPLFVKPVKASFSFGARRFGSAAELAALAGRVRWTPARAYLRPLADLLAAAGLSAADPGLLLAEAELPGRQVSLEGWVHGGRAEVLGIVDEHFHPGTASFERFTYPSRLPPPVQRRMAEVARRFLAAAGYDGAPFNMELTWDEATDRVGLVEVNAKLASQFTDLFEKVDGESAYAVLLALALGDAPRPPRRRGSHRVAASFPLRVLASGAGRSGAFGGGPGAGDALGCGEGGFGDAVVRRVPSPADVAALQARFPDARLEVGVRVGDRLAGGLQDAASFRWAVLNLGAASWRELEARRAEALALLPFEIGEERSWRAS